MTRIHSILADIMRKSLSAAIPIWCTQESHLEKSGAPPFRLDRMGYWRLRRAAFAGHAPFNHLYRKGRVPAIFSKCHWRVSFRFR